MSYTIKDFRSQFPDDAACLAYIFAQRHPEGIICPKCARKDTYTPIAKRRAYACICGHQISPCAGTIFHKSPTSLQTWFHAIFLMSVGKNGVSAKEIQRHVGVTYKCAWRMAHQIRQLMQQDGEALSGMVEVDETYIGGSRRMSAKMENKTPVIGMKQRDGRLVAKAMPDRTRFSVVPVIEQNIAAGSTLLTDESSLYKIMPALGYEHAKVMHSANEYVRGPVHTNSIEGFWSQLKRSINGTFHQVSGKHLQKYVNEFAYRYNRRKSGVPMFQHLASSVAALHAPAV